LCISGATSAESREPTLTAVAASAGFVVLVSAMTCSSTEVTAEVASVVGEPVRATFTSWVEVAFAATGIPVSVGVSRVPGTVAPYRPVSMR
jgi:hypothetical protein